MIRRILLIEDEKDQRDLLRTYLTRDGWADDAINEAETLADVPRHLGTGLSAVLVDLQLPDHAGIGVVREVRPLIGPWVPLVVVTGNQDPTAEAECLLAGASFFLRKDEIVVDQGAGLNRWLRNRLAEDETQAKTTPGALERTATLLAVQDLGAVGARMETVALEATQSNSSAHERILQELVRIREGRQRGRFGIVWRLLREWSDPAVRKEAKEAAQDFAVFATIVGGILAGAVGGIYKLGDSYGIWAMLQEIQP
jgi:CheY-like chemotaxis protein